MMMNNPQQIFADYKTSIDIQLTKYFNAHLKHSPQMLQEAIRYCSLNAGKRIRALLVYGIGEIFSASIEQLHAPACAVELIHAYSLIHDDLPAMDDSPLRRGKPACHIIYGDAIAILAGDTLQTLAFEILSQAKFLSDKQCLQSITELSRASGANGMIGGQVIDITATGKKLDLNQLTHLHQLKTGKLIEASAVLGAISAKASETDITKIRQFASHLGLAFQIQDDLLDVMGTTTELGKPCHDQANLKNTYTTLLGVNIAKEKLQYEINAAQNILEEITPEAHWLHTLVDFITTRTY